MEDNIEIVQLDIQNFFEEKQIDYKGGKMVRIVAALSSKLKRFMSRKVEKISSDSSELMAQYEQNEAIIANDESSEEELKEAQKENKKIVKQLGRFHVISGVINDSFKLEEETEKEQEAGNIVPEENLGQTADSKEIDNGGQYEDSALEEINADPFISNFAADMVLSGQTPGTEVENEPEVMVGGQSVGEFLGNITKSPDFVNFSDSVQIDNDDVNEEPEIKDDFNENDRSDMPEDSDSTEYLTSLVNGLSLEQTDEQKVSGDLEQDSLDDEEKILPDKMIVGEDNQAATDSENDEFSIILNDLNNQGQLSLEQTDEQKISDDSEQDSLDDEEKTLPDGMTVGEDNQAATDSINIKSSDDELPLTQPLIEKGIQEYGDNFEEDWKNSDLSEQIYLRNSVMNPYESREIGFPTQEAATEAELLAGQWEDEGYAKQDIDYLLNLFKEAEQEKQLSGDNSSHYKEAKDLLDEEVFKRAPKEKAEDVSNEMQTDMGTTWVFGQNSEENYEPAAPATSFEEQFPIKEVETVEETTKHDEAPESEKSVSEEDVNAVEVNETVVEEQGGYEEIAENNAQANVTEIKEKDEKIKKLKAQSKKDKKEKQKLKEEAAELREKIQRLEEMVQKLEAEKAQSKEKIESMYSEFQKIYGTEEYITEEKEGPTL